MTFNEYIAKRRITDTPAGDFTKDARSDRNFPEMQTWAELKSYLDQKVTGSHKPLVIAAGREVWQAYVRQRRKAAG